MKVVKRILLQSIHRVWIGLFGAWALLLTGVFAPLTGTPGALQAWRLRGLLETRTEQLETLQLASVRIDSEVGYLTRSKATQEREIRKTLGYVGPDEMVFDFTAEQPQGSSEKLK